MCIRTGQLLIIFIAICLSLTRAQTSYQEWICRTRGTDLTSCDLQCASGLARPNGCEICACRESLCTDTPMVKCPEGWHCEVEQSGSSWFPIDTPTCVQGIASQTPKSTLSPLAAPNEETTTAATTTSTTSTTSTTTSVTTTTPQLLLIKTTKSTATVAQTCEQRGRCDSTGICDDTSYVCRSDGRCCRPDNLRPEPQADIPRCQQKPSIGVCRAYTVQYVYDINIGKCTETIFGGCGQSGNSFVTLEECKEICEKPCQQPHSDGPCRANIPRFYFDFDENRCLLFDYGGCHGNSNNFATVEECDIQCSGLSKSGVSVYSTKYRSNAKSLMTYSGNENNVNANKETNTDVDNSKQNDTSNDSISVGLFAPNNNGGSTKDAETKEAEDVDATSSNRKESTTANTVNSDSNEEGNDSNDENVKPSSENSSDGNPLNSIMDSYKKSKPISNPNLLPFSTSNDEQDSEHGANTDTKPDTTDNEDDVTASDTDKDNSGGQTRTLPDFLKLFLGRG